ncbi:MAG TPA: hypothetical protein VJH22_06455 [Candidatus Nanoarchaeia archaeon]|nr:hypothetical protein [Candidatus Nanoarchaeia archaeon]
MAKKEGISLFLVDDYSDPSLRDRHMADNLRKIHGKVLYLCGNIHASKLLIPIPPFFRLLNSILSLIGKGMILPPGNLQPCGSYLPKKETDSYKIVALNGGDYYNLRKKSMRPDQELRARDSPLPTVINGEGGYDHLYVVDRFTYSR